MVPWSLWAAKVAVLVAGAVLSLGVVLAQQHAAAVPANIALTNPEGNALQRARLWGVVSKSVVNRVNPDDATAAMKVWFDALGRRNGMLLDSSVTIASGASEIRPLLQSRSVDLLVLDTPTFLDLESTHLLVPVLGNARGTQEGPLYSYVLLVKAASLGNGLAGLRGKNVLVYSRNASNGGGAWLEVLAAKEKLGRAALFFSSVKVVDKAPACTLAVFFGSADACVVDEIDLKLAAEMNPQLGELKVVARSRPITDSVIAMPIQSTPHQKNMLEGMLGLHLDPRGRILLMVFKTERLIPLRTSDLDGARELWSEYYRITRGTNRASALNIGAVSDDPGRGSR